MNAYAFTDAFLLLVVFAPRVFGTLHFNYDIRLNCSRQPLSGDLVIWKGDTEIITFPLFHEKSFVKSESYFPDDLPTGETVGVLKSPCGVLSEIGKLCWNVFTIPLALDETGTENDFNIYTVASINLKAQLRELDTDVVDSIERICE